MFSGGAAGGCPSGDPLDSYRHTVEEQIANALQDIANCPCGGSGRWTNIADFNFSDPDVACPSGFTLRTSEPRGCKRQLFEAATCKSVIFSSGGQSYSRVCGRVNAYQQGTTDAFNIAAGPRTLEEIYVDGVSLTHGAPGPRQHIWTFAAANFRGGNYAETALNCDCTNTAFDWPYALPSFVNDNYFCATGNPGWGQRSDLIFSHNLLWDGEGCSPDNTCCQLNNPPWFCTTLPQPTTDDIEMRVCNNEDERNEDVILTFVSISIM